MANQSSPSVLVIIPARGGSKGVPRKNIRSLAGKPVLLHCAETALKSAYNPTVVVSSEDPEIIEIAEEKGVRVVRRPQELATDTAQLCQVSHHIYHQFKEDGVQFDVVISLQPTNPFLNSESLDRAIELWMETGCDSVSSVAEVTQGHPYICRKVLDGGVIEPFMELPADAVNNRQNRTTAYYLTGGFYLRSAAHIERGNPVGHWLGEYTCGVVVSELEAVDINTELDFQFAEFLARQDTQNG